MIKRILPIYMILFCLGCTQTTEEKVAIFSKQLPNDKIIKVEKVNKDTTTKGIFTHNNYGTVHRFTYSFTVNTNEIRWNGGSAEPKSIIFCKETVYAKSLKNKLMTVPKTDSVTHQNITSTHYEIREEIQKYVDERYFFKLLGDDYWITITPEEYENQNMNCEEYPIPNDKELSITIESTLSKY